MNTYEYKTKYFNGREMDESFAEHLSDYLNKLGENGWELVSVLSYPQLGSTKYSLVGIKQNAICILKK